MTASSARISTAFAVQAARTPGGLCAATLAVLGVTGVGITLLSGNLSGPVCASDERSGLLEDLQFTLGEGPCKDAFDSGRAVAAPRLDAPTSVRWPAFVDQASKKGLGGVFAYPLTSPSVRLGVLTLYQDVPGPLTAAQHSDAGAIAVVLTHTMLEMISESAGGVAVEDAVAHRAEVHQATGMVSAQLEVSPEDALARIRAHAYVSDQPIRTVAADIVARRLRFE